MVVLCYRACACAAAATTSRPPLSSALRTNSIYILSLAPYTTRWTTDSRLIPCFLARPFVQRKPPVLRRPEAASHHSLATRSDDAGENGVATPVTATTTTTTIITIITATTNATLIT